MPSGAEFSGTVALVFDQLYDIRFEFKDMDGPAWATLSYSASTLTKRVVPSNRLYFSPAHVYGSPFRLYVNPTILCAATSSASGPGLSAGTVGVQAAFTITARVSVGLSDAFPHLGLVFPLLI